MDGGASDCIEEGLWNGWRKVNIRSSMKEKRGGSLWYAFFLVFVALILLS
jgi:hypothetical protein